MLGGTALGWIAPGQTAVPTKTGVTTCRWDAAGEVWDGPCNWDEITGPQFADGLIGRGTLAATALQTGVLLDEDLHASGKLGGTLTTSGKDLQGDVIGQIGRASCRERGVV